MKSKVCFMEADVEGLPNFFYPIKTNNMEENQTQRVLTFGERAVGITFNPGKIPAVEAIKQNCAKTIDHLNDLRNATEDPEEKRMYSTAITNIQTGQMWGVKAATWNCLNSLS